MPRCCKGARTSILLAEAIIALVAGRQGALADESGVSFWLLGTYATQAAVPSDPGLAAASKAVLIRRRTISC